MSIYDEAHTIDQIAAVMRSCVSRGVCKSDALDEALAVRGDMPVEACYEIAEISYDSVIQSHLQSLGVTAGHLLSPSVTQGHDESPGGPREVTQLVTQFVERQKGEFNVRTLDDMCGFKADQRNARTKALSRLEKQGKIVRVNSKIGVYRTVGGKKRSMDLLNCSIEEFPIVLPFGLNDMVEVYPKEVILIAGESNAGKTSLMFWILWHTLCNLKSKGILNTVNTQDNSKGISLRYISSEMGENQTARKAASLVVDDPEPLKTWAEYVDCIEVDGPVQDDIIPYGLNVLDYLEPPDNDYAKMVGAIADIFHKLTSGVAIISIQKRSNSEEGVGGSGTREKPRLSLNVTENKVDGAYAFSTVKITKAKHYRDYNPSGLEFDFKVSNRGGKVVPISGRWMPKKELDGVRKMPNYGQMSNGSALMGEMHGLRAQSAPF